METNDFQNVALTEVRRLLIDSNIQGAFKEEGVRESYLHLRNDEIDLDIWIYKDEVGFGLREEDLHCEKQDFDSPDEMLSFFMTRLSECLKQKSVR